MTKTNEKVDFGYKRVSAPAKDKLVREVFESVAQKYDLMNDAMSVGVHRLWKHDFVSGLNAGPDSSILDLAGGTGDIAFRLLKNGAGKVTVCDPSAEMMEVGKDRALDQNIRGHLDWVCAPAESLPFEDNSFDFVTISFGLRNVTDRATALKEMHRVLKFGGQLHCLEFSQMQLPGFNKLYEFYSFNIIPKLGGWLANDEDSYQYLVESIARFPTQEQLEDEFNAAGFKQVSHRNLSGGITAIHRGWKL